MVAAPQWQQQAWTRRWASTTTDAAEKAEEHLPEETHEEGTTAEVDPKDAKIAELSKQVAYSLAEAENARKIAVRDVDTARQYALKSFAKELLEVVDNLDRALGSVTKEKLEEDASLATLHKGVTMTQGTLTRILTKNGVTKQVVNNGDKFDPNLHEALFNIPNTADSTPGTVGNVIKNGFDYKERVLRASQVGVFQEDQD